MRFVSFAGLTLAFACSLDGSYSESGLDSVDSGLDTGAGAETGDEVTPGDPGYPDESTLPQLGDCDGAEEGYIAPSSAPCTSGVVAWLDSDLSTYSSLAAALRDSTDGETVNICPGTVTGSTSVSKSVTLRGYGVNRTVLSGAWSSRVLQISGDATIGVTGLTIAYGFDDYDGGSVTMSNGDVSFSHVRFERNNAGYQGGAISQTGGDLVVSESCFLFNGSDYEGGAIASSSGDLDITDTVFVYNDAGYEGGAIDFGGWDDGYELNISGGTFAWNIAGYSGGALSIGSWEESTVTVEDSRFEDNFAEYEGGAISLGSWGGNHLVMSGSALVENESRSGAAIDVGGWGTHSADLEGSWLLDNEATSEGGGLEVGSRCTATLLISGGGVVGNIGSRGGGLSITSSTALSVTDAHFGAGVGDNQGGDVNEYSGWGAGATFTCASSVCL